MKSGGGSFGHISVQVGADWWTHLSTYEDYSPILDIEVGSTSVSVCIADGNFDEPAVQFARELAEQAAKFAAEVERLHGVRGGNDQGRDGGAGTGEAA